MTQKQKDIMRIVLWHEIVALFATIATAVVYSRGISTEWWGDYHHRLTASKVFVRELLSVRPIALAIGIFTLLFSLHNAYIPIDMLKIGTFSLILCYERIALIASFTTATFYSFHIVDKWWESYIQGCGSYRTFNEYMSYFTSHLLDDIPILLFLGFFMFLVGLFHSFRRSKNLQ